MTSNPKAILALLPNWLGDAAMCTPALRALARRFPEARLIPVGRRPACELVEGLSWLDPDPVIVPPRPSMRQMFSLQLPAGVDRPDLAVVFPHSFRAALIARVLSAQRVLGYMRGGRTLLLSDRVEPHNTAGRIKPIYMADEYLTLVKALGCKDDKKGLELVANPERVAAFREQTAGAGPLIGIAPGAAFGPSKLWPSDRFASLIDQLHKTIGARIVLITGPGEEPIRDAVRAKATAPLTVYDDGQSSIAKLKAVVSALDLLVCNDSGTRHVAVAFHVPTVCIMGPTAPAYSCGPYERGKVLRVDVDCGPCQKPVCATDHRCMTRIGVDWVVDTVKETLQNPAPALQS